MSAFLTAEKVRQVRFKESKYISEAARASGLYKAHEYPFCLSDEWRSENLFEGIRKDAVDFFERHKIKWHDGRNHLPSNHMCDSQVCCVNFLFPFSDQPQALASLLRPVFPTLAEMLPVEDGRFMTFEWIGERDYLGEAKRYHNQKRSRGANVTSADAAVMFRHQNGSRQIVLIEWKYTESYSPTNLAEGQSGQTRLTTYQSLYHQDDCPLDRLKLPGYYALFYEPFYQLMRQQLLANEMEKAHESSVEFVSLLHISPAHNLDFKKVTSPTLRDCGDSPIGIWRNLVLSADRFAGVSTEDLFGRFNTCPYPALEPWYQYILARYGWVKQEPSFV